MRNRFGLLVVSLALQSGAVHALTADEIVTRYIEARGGAEKIQTLRSVRLTGKLEFGRRSSVVVADWGEIIKRPGMLRDETTMQGLTSVDAFDGKDAWSVSPFQGRRDPQRASADETRQRAQQADIEGPLVRWHEKGHRVEYLGTEDVDGTSALRLRVSLKDGDTAYMFLDPDYFLEIRRVMVRHVRGAEQVTETDLGNYGQVAGVWMPFSIESGRQGGPKNSRITVEQAEANVELDDSVFRYPAQKGSVARSIIAGPAGAPASTKPPPPPTAKAAAPAADSSVLSGLEARNIGSATMSGRISAVTGFNEGGKTTLFVAAASGGVWKSMDSGTTFKAVFDKQSVQSIGAIAIDPKNTKTIWVGTGESWTRNSASIGDGIYKSTDGGETWKNMGLPSSERIAKIVVHPKNGSIVL